MLGVLLAANVVVATAGVWLGAALLDDPAAYFRELAPGTWLSAAHILAAAVVARAIHRRRSDRSRRWYEDFWGLCAAGLGGLAVVELTQPTVFVGKWLQYDLGLRPPGGVADIDAMLLVALLTVLAGALLPRALVLLAHPRALALFAVGVALGVASQGLDTLWPVSTWEFVVEDGLKALAQPFLVTGFLLVLADRRADGASPVSAD